MCFQLARSMLHRTHGVAFSRSGEHLCRSAFAGEPGEIGKYRCHEVAVMRIGLREVSSIQIQDVTRLCDCLGPGGGRHGEELELDSRLVVAQQFCVGLDVGEHATDIGGLLRRHAAMLVEIDRVFIHQMRSRPYAVHQTDRLMEIISTEEWRGAAPWTMIIVATRRKLGNESPSIISSSVIT